MALRYLFSRKSHGAVNVISAVSVASVAVATAAMVIVLSVFNGFAQLSERQLGKLDPPVAVAPAAGKVFAGGDSLCARLASLPEVATAAGVLSDQAFAVARECQMPVVIKGVGEGYADASHLADIIIDGSPALAPLPGGWYGAVLSPGAAIGLNTRPKSPWTITIYEPRRLGRYNPANPAASFRTDTVACMGVYSVEQQEYDRDMVLLPLEAARSLLDYSSGELSQIAIWPAAGCSAEEAAAAVRRALDATSATASLRVLDRMQQQPDLFRMIAVEKWITFAMLAFILVIASFNIISTLSMMVLEKEPNMAVLRAMGATPRFVSAIFGNQGRLITLCGGGVGIVAGALLVSGQSAFGWIKLQTSDPTLLMVDAYPVVLRATDLLTVAAFLVGASLLIAVIASRLPQK